jgi:acyl-CoA thioesterase-1
MHRTRSLLFALLLLATLIAACGGESAGLPRLGDGDVVLAFGDSLTYGVGAAEKQAYPAVLQALIGKRVINAGVPGETTGEGLQRLPQALDQYQPKILLLCLGGNDLLRRFRAAETAANLRSMVALARARGVAVVLIGVPEPKLFGGPPEFYENIAGEFALPYEDEIMDTVLKTPSLKADAIHPNAKGYRIIADALAVLLRGAGAV